LLHKRYILFLQRLILTIRVTGVLLHLFTLKKILWLVHSLQLRSTLVSACTMSF